MATDTQEEYCKGCARNEKCGMIQACRVLPGEKKKKRTMTVHSALHFCTRLLIVVSEQRHQAITESSSALAASSSPASCS
ncbi:hypothetical protein E4Z61_11310 [Citrobacter tructae]|uniref:Uncharacterized protein n=1 Tax=Citrobacter tructae TaxID=2562449 RepID=A0ABX5T6H4_9ENTR|nr:hypothetical protein E4Z61_11310 [Citrobacter tructae]